VKRLTKRTDGNNLRRIRTDDGGDRLGEGEDVVELIFLESSGEGKCKIHIVIGKVIGKRQTADGEVQIREDLVIIRSFIVQILKCIERIQRQRRDRRQSTRWMMLVDGESETGGEKSGVRKDDVEGSVSNEERGRVDYLGDEGKDELKDDFGRDVQRLRVSH
jgi:hypothetical protein